jgi:ABC-type phosphate transport system auxiliary subunit
MASVRWSEVWVAFGANFARESPPMQIAIILGIGLIVAMALEGLHATFFPARFMRHRYNASHHTAAL